MIEGDNNAVGSKRWWCEVQMDKHFISSLGKQAPPPPPPPPRNNSIQYNKIQINNQTIFRSPEGHQANHTNPTNPPRDRAKRGSKLRRNGRAGRKVQGSSINGGPPWGGVRNCGTGGGGQSKKGWCDGLRSILLSVGWTVEEEEEEECRTT